jgi:type IV secretion system protein VirB8
MRFGVELVLLLAALCAAPAAAVDAEAAGAAVAPFYGAGRDLDWVARYVFAREGYDPAAPEEALDFISLVSAPRVELQYYELTDGPGGRESHFGKKTRVEVVIRSVSLIGANEAIVRFLTRKADAATGERQPPERWIATIGYVFAGAPVNAENRKPNPLGFQVTGYRVEPNLVGARETGR